MAQITIKDIKSGDVSLLRIAPATLTAAAKTIVAAQGAGYRGAIVDVGFQNTDTVTRTLTISDGTTTFGQYDIPAGQSVTIFWWPLDMAWIGAANTAIVATPSADSVIKCTGGRYYKKAA